MAKAAPDPAAVEELIARTRAWIPLFESLLAGCHCLGGDAVSVMDVCAFPHLKHAMVETSPEDEEPFHGILERCPKPAGTYLLLCDWIRRVDALPRA